MSRFEAWALPSVREEAIRLAVESAGMRWDCCSHVTATRSLQRSIVESGRAAVAIEQLIELIVRQRPRGGEEPIGIAAFPSQADLERDGARGYLERSRAWSRLVNGARTRLAVRFDDALRRFRREHPQCGEVARLLVESRREYRLTLKALIESGARPVRADVHAGMDLRQVGLAAWAWIEDMMPDLHAVRDDLWEEHGSTPGEELIGRVRGALRQAFPTSGCAERWTILHHGFHFYTPPQWALFRLLRRVGVVDQIFVVHDDGENPCFEVWRRFFGPDASAWGMPEPRRFALDHEPQAAAMGFLRAWSGERVDRDALAPILSLRRFRSVVECVRQLDADWIEARSRQGAAPSVFAADARTLQRHVERLSPFGSSGDPNLLALPVGAFLVQLYGCIGLGPGGSVEARIEPEALRDIAASGFLQERLPGLVAALARAMPFFGGCVTPTEWIDRAGTLERLVRDVPKGLAPRAAGQDDLTRMRSAADNPLRLAPWADLSSEETGAIVRAIGEIARVVQELAREARIPFGRHSADLLKRVQQGLSQLPPKDKESFEARFRGFRIGRDDETLDVAGLIDVVRILLGREVDFEDDDPGSDPADGSDRGVRPLRALDALGFAPAQGRVHVANLSDAAFPGFASPVGWPFRLESLEGLPEESGRLMRLRAANAVPDGLYLMWLALDGAGPACGAQLSWIAEIDGEDRNPSPLLMMLADLTKAAEAVRERIGGLPIGTAESGADVTTTRPRPEPQKPRKAQVGAEKVVERLPPVPAASVLACPRRFAIQWALGPSTSFRAPHHHQMLFGNLIGWLRMRGHDGEHLCRDWWKHASEAERLSSIRVSVVKPGGAHPAWIHTLGGSKGGSSPIDLAYRSAARPDDRRTLAPQLMESLLLDQDGWLPEPVGDDRVRHADACRNCPVRSRCLREREQQDDED